MIKIYPRKCVYCKTKFEPKSANHIACGVDCVVAYKRKQSERAEAKKSAENKKILKEKVKTLTDYENEAKKSFQKFIRLRDHDQPCISCGKYDCPDWAGGHYYPAGVYSGMMFDERNCHKQCNSHCNKFRNGNPIEYRRGLIERYGEAYVKELETDALQRRDYKYTKQELIAKRLQYDLKCKEFKKH